MREYLKKLQLVFWVPFTVLVVLLCLAPFFVNTYPYKGEVAKIVMIYFIWTNQLFDIKKVL